MIIKRMKKQIINIKIIIIITSLLSFVKYNTIKIIFMLFCIIFYKKAYFFCHIFLCFTNMFLIKRFPLCRLKLKYGKKFQQRGSFFFVCLIFKAKLYMSLCFFGNSFNYSLPTTQLIYIS